MRVQPHCTHFKADSEWPRCGTRYVQGRVRKANSYAILSYRASSRRYRLLQAQPTDSIDPSVVRHLGFTKDVLTKFEDEYFDWIYVDADHSYEGTLRDAKLGAPKIRSGGFLVFNDFAHLDTSYGRYGVHRAVSEFAVNMKWPFAFLAFSPDGLYDVALRKP